MSHSFIFFIDKEVYILKRGAKRATQSIEDIYPNRQKAQPRKRATKQEVLQHRHPPSTSAQPIQEAN